MAEKTALYLLMDWLAAESNSENYKALVWIRLSTPQLSSFENSIRSLLDWRKIKEFYHI